MTEITQADRDAAAEWGPALLTWDEDDHAEVETALAKHFAEHRIKAEQKIAAWLEKQGETHRSIWGVSIDPKIMRLAEGIKAGEHL